MAQADPIRTRAEVDLVLVDEHGRRDVYLFEHSLRIAAAAEKIAGMEGVPGPIDPQVLRASALYHDAGWAEQFRGSTVTRVEVLSRPTNDVQREIAADLLTERLATVMHRRSLETAASAIRHMNDRRTDLPEAQVLAEAENLDDLGVISLWQLVRRHSFEGKGVQAAIDTWQRQRDYRFWDARIHDAFRFEPTRAIARARLIALEPVYEALGRLQAGEDLAVAKLTLDPHDMPK